MHVDVIGYPFVLGTAETLRIILKSRWIFLQIRMMIRVLLNPIAPCADGIEGDIP